MNATAPADQAVVAPTSREEPGGPFSRIGAALVCLRVEAGFDSQSDGARACGIAKSQISEYERGIAAPSLETLGRILSAYRASPHDLADALELDEAANVRLTLQRPQDANVITSRLFREDRSFTLRHHAGGIFSLLYKEVDE